MTHLQVPLLVTLAAQLEVKPLFQALQGDTFAIPAYLDYVATFTWALSGAIVGARRGFDLMGVLVVALVSSMGGGLLRDGLFLQRPPALLWDGTFLSLIVLATAIVYAVARRLVVTPRWMVPDKLIELIDAIGTPSFAVVGMQLAFERNFSLPGVVLIGMINGVGGGLLRDVIVGDRPLLLQPGQYVSFVVLTACGIFVGATQWLGISAMPAALATIAVFFGVRALTIRYNWKSEALLREAVQ